MTSWSCLCPVNDQGYLIVDSLARHTTPFLIEGVARGSNNVRLAPPRALHSGRVCACVIIECVAPRLVAHQTLLSKIEQVHTIYIS